MADGMTFSAETIHGFIHISGTQEKLCHLTADVRVWARTVEKADEIADKLKVDLDKNAEQITVVIEKPEIQYDYRIHADYDVRLPKNTNLILKTTHGYIKCENIEGNVTAATTHDEIECRSITGDLRLNTTHGDITLEHINGGVEAGTTHDSIRAEYVSGPVELKTTHGEIVCRQLDTNRLQARTSHDDVNIGFVNSIEGQIEADVETSHGNIDFDLPVNFAGSIFMSTTHGRIKSDVPVVVKGEISEDRISGTIGDGSGRIDLRTTHGSIIVE
jgi:DUF4097 and DUF4098 domain-containing protein YvlB